MMNPARYTPATAWSAEGGRVALVTCRTCGAALLLSMEINVLELHDQFHNPPPPISTTVTVIPIPKDDQKGATS